MCFWKRKKSEPEPAASPVFVPVLNHLTDADLASKALSDIEISADLVSRVNFKDVSARLSKTLEALDAAKGELEGTKRAEFHVKFWNGLTGKNHEVATSAQETLVESTKVMGELLVVNCLLSKAINKQQTELKDQQNHLIRQQAKLDRQDQELAKLNHQLLEMQRKQRMVIKERIDATDRRINETSVRWMLPTVLSVVSALAASAAIMLSLGLLR